MCKHAPLPHHEAEHPRKALENLDSVGEPTENVAGIALGGLRNDEHAATPPGTMQDVANVNASVLTCRPLVP